MKCAKITEAGTKYGAWSIMPVDKSSFGSLMPELNRMAVGSKATYKYCYDCDNWGKFRDFFDSHISSYQVKIVEMSDKRLNSLPEFEGF